MNSQVLRSHLALLLAMMLWGSSFVAFKVMLTDMTPMVVVFLRIAVAAAAFLVAWPWVRQGFRYRQGDWRYLLAMALFEPCLYFIFESYALQNTGAGQAGVITAMLPLMVAVMAFFVLGERSSARQWTGFGIAVSGVIWMSLSGEENEQAPNPMLGNFLQLLAMMSAVGYTLLAKQLTRRYSAFFLTAAQSFVGAVFFLPLALASDWPTQIPMNSVAILIYLGLGVSLGAYGLFNYALTHLRASVAAGYTNLLPVFALMFAMLLLNERLTNTQWLAIAVIFAGVVLSYEREPVIPTEIPPAVTG
ncbi:MAG: DMT family transporter [Pseudohongiellaceae bacterium]